MRQSSSRYEYQEVCPKGIKVKFIAKLNREFMKAKTGTVVTSEITADSREREVFT